jgi:hypothetical protein
MSIVTAVDHGQYVSVHGEHGRILCSIPKTTTDSLQGYTSSTVSIKQRQCIITYDETGRIISTVSTP